MATYQGNEIRKQGSGVSSAATGLQQAGLARWCSLSTGGWEPSGAANPARALAGAGAFAFGFRAALAELGGQLRQTREQALQPCQRRRTLHLNSGAGRLVGRETDVLAKSRRRIWGETAMGLKHLVMSVALVASASVVVTTAQAEDGIYIPLMSYRTGPYSLRFREQT